MTVSFNTSTRTNPSMHGEKTQPAQQQQGEKGKNNLFKTAAGIYSLLDPAGALTAAATFFGTAAAVTTTTGASLLGNPAVTSIGTAIATGVTTAVTLYATQKAGQKLDVTR